jgi:tRNA-specific 2-thiouridylase
MARVFVGMSGGVDSSVAAKRLITVGHEVVGVFIKVWQPDFIRCDWEKERLDAMRVAAHLDIPFLTMNAEEAYKKEVADYMVAAYRNGLTPNPDVMCNEHVKFGAFYEWARTSGADFVATGHYARMKHEGDSHTLHTAIDESKDQSYFLARIHPDVLPYILFPIGDTKKDAIRMEAKEAGIPTAEKADSQGLCFLGQVDMKEFLNHYITLVPGDVLSEAGVVIGKHQGALVYTLGQRHGFLIFEKGTETRPHYVIDRDIEKNTITVRSTPKESVAGGEVTLTDLNILGTGFSDEMEAVFRYHGPRERVRVKMTKEGGAILHPLSTIQTPARGQICVLYKGDECCGGGVIS